MAADPRIPLLKKLVTEMKEAVDARGLAEGTRGMSGREENLQPKSLVDDVDAPIGRFEIQHGWPFDPPPPPGWRFSIGVGAILLLALVGACTVAWAGFHYAPDLGRWAHALLVGRS